MCELTSDTSHLDNFLKEISDANISSKLNQNPFANPNTNYSILENIIADARNNHIPSKFVKFNKHKHKKSKWITNGILKSLNHKDKLYKKYRSTPLNTPEYETNKINYKTYNNILKRNIKEAKKRYYESCFNKYKHDMKNTWKTINNILNKTEKKCDFPNFFNHNDSIITDKKEIADAFNNYFIDIGPNLASKIIPPNDLHFTDFIRTNHTCRLRFNMIDELAIEKIINNMLPKQSCGYDNISLKLLKLLKLELIKPLTIIINQILNTGYFPENLKIGKVKPLLKKGDNSTFSNYRPISLLPTISKIFEKVIYDQLYAYFNDNNLFYSSQYGFRSQHSTELAGLELADRIIQNLDKKESQINIYIDLSKAFDTLDHDILLHKLEYYGITGSAYYLLKNYLSGRKQYVEYDHVTSSLLDIKTGVPQGSILGPLLFIIYINDISKVSSLLDFIIYADNTTLSSVINSIGNDENSIGNTLNKELDKVVSWLKVNKLSLNIDKTKYMIFYPHQKKVKKPKLMIENYEIECVDEFNFLGITFDKHMTWKPHIDRIANKLNRTIGILNCLKRQLPMHIKLTLYYSLVQPHIIYGILLWGHNCDRILKLQKKIIRIISLSKYNAHTNPLFRSLNILKVNDTFSLYTLKFYHKYINNKVPLYFQSFQITRVHEIHNYNTRSSNNIQLHRVNHELAKRCIRFSLPVLRSNTDDKILTKVYTHSLKGFSLYIKRSFIQNYNIVCQIENCYICRRAAD